MHKEILLNRLRDATTSLAQFRETTHRLALLLAAEVGNFLKTEKKTIQTRYATTQVLEYNQDIVLVVIVRSGFALLPAFLSFFPAARVGVIGLKRNPTTAKADLYYSNVPTINPSDAVVILDPTVATGGTAQSALLVLQLKGIAAHQCIFVSFLASCRGYDTLTSQFPQMKLITVAIDPELNSKNYIVPGFGDFGDRYFGT